MIQVKSLKDSGLLEYLKELGDLRNELLDINMSLSVSCSTKLEQERMRIIGRIRCIAVAISQYPINEHTFNY